MIGTDTCANCQSLHLDKAIEITIDAGVDLFSKIRRLWAFQISHKIYGMISKFKLVRGKQQSERDIIRAWYGDVTAIS